MESGGCDESRYYDNDPEGRGESGRSNDGTEERRKYETENGQRPDQERGESRELGEGAYTRDREGLERKEYEGSEERRHHDNEERVNERENGGYSYTYTTKRRPRRRDIRYVNYAFSGPREDVAEKEAQEWFDNLSMAGGEEENDPLKIWPKGQKYRTGTTNASPQMQERLQRCEQDQERHEYKIHIPRLEKRNESLDIYPLLHVEESQSKPGQAAPLKLLGNTRRSSICNNSAGVFAAMHPGSENGNYTIRKKRNVHRNHLKEHRASIAEMSAMTRYYKQKESEEEEKRLASGTIRNWNKDSRKKFAKRLRECPNFVERNMEAITEQSQYAREVRKIPGPDYSYMHQRGKVPKYLRQRKSELLEQAEEREREHKITPAIPKGRKVMSETERQQTLDDLEQRHEQLSQILKSFPLAFDTAHQIRIRSETEEELKRIEASHSYYSNPKIYVLEPNPRSVDIIFSKTPPSPQRTSHSAFPYLDKTQKSYCLDGDGQITGSSSTRAHIIPMTYSNDQCGICFAPMQRVIKSPESRPLRCTACMLKLKTRKRSLWTLTKPIQQ